MENVYLNENEIELGQTSKGYWYCKSMKISCYSIRDGIALAETIMEDVTKLLNKYNIKNK